MKNVGRECQDVHKKNVCTDSSVVCIITLFFKKKTAGPISWHSMSNVGLVVLKCLRQSLPSERVFIMNDPPELSPLRSQDNMMVFIVFLVRSVMSFMIYGKEEFSYRYFAVISQIFVLSNTWDGNAALLVNVLYDILHCKP